jgi:hypothetical protein
MAWIWLLVDQMLNPPAERKQKLVLFYALGEQIMKLCSLAFVSVLHTRHAWDFGIDSGEEALASSLLTGVQRAGLYALYLIRKWLLLRAQFVKTCELLLVESAGQQHVWNVPIISTYNVQASTTVIAGCSTQACWRCVSTKCESVWTL